MIFMKPMEALAVFAAISSLLTISTAIDTISATQPIKDGETIVSSGGSFELGFFSPGNSKNRFVGIWYKKISARTIVWVANRQIPLNNTSGVLKINNSGFLNLLASTNEIVWSSSNTSRSGPNPVAQLLDNGNLVIREKNDDDPDNFLWQSFDYPTDTHLPEMKLGKNFVTGLETYLSSWKSDDDPAPGEFTYHLDPRGYPQIILRKGSVETYRTGPWNGLRFSGRPSISQNKIYTHKLVFNKEEVYYTFELINASVLSRFMLSQNGIGQRWTWVSRTQRWELFLTAPTDNCDTYNKCGAYGSCNIDNGPVCRCLDNFEAKYENDWGNADWSNGCIRKKPLDCQKGDGFSKISRVKLPDTRSSWYNDTMSPKECQIVCLKNCSCMAYASIDISNGESGCLQWFGDLIDIRDFSGGGQDFYIRVAFSDSDKNLMVQKSGSNTNKGKAVIISVSLSVGSVILGLSLAAYIWKKKKKKKKTERSLGCNLRQDYSIESQKEDLDLPFFRLSAIAYATNYFSNENKLGQGGFGPVYKGVLEDGREIAVKCLSKTSKQGPDEFMNEVKCIAKLQHRNLVRLLGYCIQGDENMLIYEYMPNKSLDSYIFDETRSTLLDWPKCFHIINGIARGLLYLHQDSRLRIIHRDLKASNILLDVEMNAKISDFGMARSFGENETSANTSRVVGTYGYMSPEYAVDGLFSVKSDVFSFGVIVMEIVSGERNRGFIHHDHCHNLLGHAWRLHTEGRSLELIHPHIRDTCKNMYEVLRTIHIGLLCVQQSPEDRPNMSTVVLMLGGEGVLPMPTQPGFFTERNITASECFSKTFFTDDTASTLFEGR